MPHDPLPTISVASIGMNMTFPISVMPYASRAMTSNLRSISSWRSRRMP